MVFLVALGLKVEAKIHYKDMRCFLRCFELNLGLLFSQNWSYRDHRYIEALVRDLFSRNTGFNFEHGCPES